MQFFNSKIPTIRDSKLSAVKSRLFWIQHNFLAGLRKSCAKRISNFEFRISNSIIVAVLIVLLGSSCVRNKDYIYLQSKEQIDSVFVAYSKIPEYYIQYNDVLRVTIKSIDPKISELFNLYGGNNMNNIGAQAAQAGDPFYMTGYPVDDKGEINLPVIGKIKIRGLTIEQARDSIQKQVDTYLNGAYVNVQIGGIRYALLGEVGRPGKYTVLQDRLTILEAIAQGGDLNTVANRHKVQIIRQYPDGAQIVTIDLTKQDIITSPFYFVRPNDVIYVQPLKAREYGTGLTAQQTLQTVVLSVTLLVNTLLLFERLGR
jgi:polysaccharide export outer membrane protein